jgi:hypothetical protein
MPAFTMHMRRALVVLMPFSLKPVVSVLFGSVSVAMLFSTMRVWRLLMVKWRVEVFVGRVKRVLVVLPVVILFIKMTVWRSHVVIRTIHMLIKWRGRGSGTIRSAWTAF